MRLETSLNMARLNKIQIPCNKKKFCALKKNLVSLRSYSCEHETSLNKMNGPTQKTTLF